MFTSTWLRSALHTTYIEAIKVLDQAGIAYLSLAEADWDKAPDLAEDFYRDVRVHFSGRILYAGKDLRVLNSGFRDLFAFGSPFIANPDLPKRIRHNLPLNVVDPSTMYGGTEKGYIDYPFHTGSFL